MSSKSNASFSTPNVVSINIQEQAKTDISVDSAEEFNNEPIIDLSDSNIKNIEIDCKTKSPNMQHIDIVKDDQSIVTSALKMSDKIEDTKLSIETAPFVSVLDSNALPLLDIGEPMLEISDSDVKSEEGNIKVCTPKMDESIEILETSNDNIEENYTVKKIKGIRYYVDDNNGIYSINENKEIGEKVGEYKLNKKGFLKSSFYT